MGELFSAVRERVTAQEAAERYGLAIDSHGKALCPWHDDRHPSLSFKGTRCKCFACDHGGSAIDLTAQLFGLPPLDAARKIAADFGLGVETAPMRPTGPSKGEIRRCVERWRTERYSALCEIERTGRAILDGFTPGTAEGSAVFTAALRAMSEAQTRIETLNSMTYQEIEEAYMEVVK